MTDVSKELTKHFREINDTIFNLQKERVWLDKQVRDKIIDLHNAEVKLDILDSRIKTWQEYRDNRTPIIQAEIEATKKLEDNAAVTEDNFASYTDLPRAVS